MEREWMITSYQNHICSCIYENSRLMELELLESAGGVGGSSSGHAPDYVFGQKSMGMSAHASQTDAVLGNIYVGKVQNIVKNLNAAFVEISKGVPCYFPLDENTPIYLNPKNTERLVIGDEILVQVTKEAIKQKAPSVSSALSLSGQYVVVRLGTGDVGISKKLPKDTHTKELKALVKKHITQHPWEKEPNATTPVIQSSLEKDSRETNLSEREPQAKGELHPNYDVILRTNAYTSDIEAVLQELDWLLTRLQSIVEYAKFHKPYSCLYSGISQLARIYQDLPKSELVKITTDLPEVYSELQELTIHTQEAELLRFYEPDLQPLYALYRLDRDYKEATAKQVWLKSGAYLVIEQTEAMVVIDVNTGKAVNKRNRDEHFLKINLEAATEIARQIRLRNLSGIIMIDFIDMKEESHKIQLIDHVKQVIRNDRIPTNYIDMTRLNLVELTRKKVRKSLREQL